MRIASVCALLIILAPITVACANSESGKASGSSPASSSSSESSAAAEKSTGAKQADAGKEAVGTEKKIGKALTVKDDDYTAVVTLESVTTVNGKYGKRSMAPESGTFVILDLTFEVQKGTYPVNPLYFRLRTPEGLDVDQGDGNAIYAETEPDLSSEDLTAGKKLNAKMALDVKPTPGSKIALLGPLDKVFGEWPL